MQALEQQALGGRELSRQARHQSGLLGARVRRGVQIGYAVVSPRASLVQSDRGSGEVQMVVAAAEASEEKTPVEGVGMGTAEMMIAK